VSDILALQGMEQETHDDRVVPISSLFSLICCL